MFDKVLKKIINFYDKSPKTQPQQSEPSRDSSPLDNPVYEEKKTEPITTSQTTNQADTVKPEYKKLKFTVAGVTFENENKKKIQTILNTKIKEYMEVFGYEKYDGYTNKEIIEYDTSVYEYHDITFEKDSVSFVPEPDNPYDENAIKVYIRFLEDDEPIHIGYVPKRTNQRLKKLLDANSIINLYTSVLGGKYKMVEYDYDTDKNKVVTEKDELGIKILIEYK